MWSYEVAVLKEKTVDEDDQWGGMLYESFESIFYNKNTFGVFDWLVM